MTGPLTEDEREELEWGLDRLFDAIAYGACGLMLLVAVWRFS